MDRRYSERIGLGACCLILFWLVPGESRLAARSTRPRETWDEAPAKKGTQPGKTGTTNGRQGNKRTSEPSQQQSKHRPKKRDRKPKKPDKDLIPKALRTKQAGILLLDEENGRILARHNADTTYIPASAIKLATALAALKVLGPEYRFSTRLLSNGIVSNATLYGDLYLQGTGDPLLTTPDLMAMAELLRRAGVRRVRGRFCYDTGTLPEQSRVDNNFDQDASYNQGVGPLNCNYNRFSVAWYIKYPSLFIRYRHRGRWYWRRRRRRIPQCRFTLQPQLPWLQVRQGKAPVRSWRNRFVHRTIRKNGSPISAWRMAGWSKLRGLDYLPVKQPARFTATLLAQACATMGITLDNPRAETAPRSTRSLVHFKGRSLYRIVDSMLAHSNNLIAEALLMATARRLGYRFSDLAGAARGVRTYLTRTFPTITWDGFYLANGSGLSTTTRITPRQLLGLYREAARLTFRGRPFSWLLPLSAAKGSLTHTLTGDEERYRLQAKNGGLDYVQSLSGRVYTRNGRLLSFAVLINDKQRRRREDSLRKHSRRWRKVKAGASRWYVRRRKLMYGMIRHWIKEL